MKKTLKLIPAVAMLLISAIMLSTASFAWFSMNNKVTVTGMTLKTQVSSNLLISQDTTEANFTATPLVQTRTALVEPTSTANAKSFWYTVNGAADGHKVDGNWTEYNEDTDLANTTAGKTAYDDDFNSSYAITTAGSATEYYTAYGYVDYNFYLKATYTAASQKVAMTYCSLLYNSGVPTDKAFRVAVLSSGAKDSAAAAEAVAVGAMTTVSVLAPSGATYQDPTKGVTGADARTAVTNFGTAATIDTSSAAGVKYFHVIVRVWLEGEDTTCTNSTFVSLTDAYTLALDFVLSGFDGVTALASVADRATATATGDTATATLNTSETTGATYQWYNGSGKIEGATSASYTKAAAGTEEVHCAITTTSGHVYTTNNVSVTKS